MKRNNIKKSNKILVLLIFMLFILVAGQLYLMNNIDSYNYKVESLVNQYNSINIKNQDLQSEISSTQSIINVKNSVLKKGYRNIGNVNYLPSNAYSFNINSKK